MFRKLPWNDAKAVLDAKKPDDLTFLIFTTDWCGDCKMMRPTLERIAEKFASSGVDFIHVNAEEAKLFRNPDNKWKVLKVPTMILLKGDEIVEKGYEYIPEEILSEWIENRIS
ncbi:thioredoxin 1 [Mycoplasmopsis mustelae]|uniref:Thioredoxin 1 n=1 Tax=Mycoplasmopsis mustelae TaxID=171289 RepID=A0A4R7UE95_9BACT|nr:thioredoxin family protein [Mycoplasmopsis mustelae]TDV24251.1 thioredoxin 1 [Mycoplasmopsis mustelae]